MSILLSDAWGEVTGNEPKIPAFMEVKPLSIEEYNKIERQREKVVMRRRAKAVLAKQRKRRFLKIALVVCAVSFAIGFVLGVM